MPDIIAQAVSLKERRVWAKNTYPYRWHPVLYDLVAARSKSSRGPKGRLIWRKNRDLNASGPGMKGGESSDYTAVTTVARLFAEQLGVPFLRDRVSSAEPMECGGTIYHNDAPTNSQLRILCDWAKDDEMVAKLVGSALLM